MTNDQNSMQPMAGDSKIVLYQPNESISLEVKLDAEHETVWLTQPQIAYLFGTKRPAITKHLGNIFHSGELDQNAVCSILERTVADGKVYKTHLYNPEVASTPPIGKVFLEKDFYSIFSEVFRVFY